jgi:RNAse (barnase) inhibitor barstar
MAWQVAMLLDADTNVNVGVGLMPIWAKTTDERRAYPLKWRESWNSMWHPDPGFTLIDIPPDGDLADWAVSFVPIIEEHHPSLFCLHLFGIEKSESLDSSMAELRFFPASILIEGGLSFTRPFEKVAKGLILDASDWSLRGDWFWAQDFYTAFFEAVGAPEWHGRCLDALNDSIAGGGVNKIEVPYRIVLRNVPGDNEMVSGALADFVTLFERLHAEGCPVTLELAK